MLACRQHHIVWKRGFHKGQAPLAGLGGVPQPPLPIPPRLGTKGAEKTIFEGMSRA